jgi:hypothetical protein
VERLGLHHGGEVHRDVAQLYFALGELRRMRAEGLVLTGDVASFGETLERRCQLLLDAQSAYSDVMRAHDAHWSAKAGYRVGELYQRLHSDVMAMRRPEVAQEGSEALLFEGAMRLRYSVLLTKGSRMMAHTLAMAERTGESSGWVVRAREARDALEEARRIEDEAIDALPHSREELSAALADLTRRTERKGSSAGPRRPPPGK